MRIWTVTITVCVLAVGAGAQESGTVTDESVEVAIQRGVAWIKKQRNEAGHWEPDENPQHQHWGGDTGLALLALLYAGENPRESEMAASLKWLAEQELHGTYTVGTRAHVLALVPGMTHRVQLQADLDWLIDAAWHHTSQHPGAYDYRPAPDDRDRGRWDNSVTQYGVLGVWMAADAGLPVPDVYWEDVATHFVKHQISGGGWGYDRRASVSTGSMTAAGLASLYVALDYRYAGREEDARQLLLAIRGGLNWFGANYGPENPGGSASYVYYYLYGVERVGRASGLKYFRDRDWFREGAEYLLAKQREDGSWPGTGNWMTSQRNSAFALMFLCHGRAPLLFNKLEHARDWNDELRDLAGLTRYVGHAFERLLNWQVVGFDADIADFLDAPVLYMYGNTSHDFDDEQVQKIRAYCQRGGLFFAVAGGGDEKFVASVSRLAARAFPDHVLKPLSTDHPLLSGDVSYRIDEPPRLLVIENGVRILMLICAEDLAAKWNTTTMRRHPQAFQLGANVYVYATDKSTPRSRLASPVIPRRDVEIERTLNVARIHYDGVWDVEPYGWVRLARYMANETQTRLLVTSRVRLDDALLEEFPIAHITGTGAFELSAAELQGLKRFLRRGGLLIADAAGGSRAFSASLEKYLAEVSPDPARLVPDDSALLSGAGIPGAVDLRGARYRRAARRLGGGRAVPRLVGYPRGRRFAVIHSPLDLSAGLLGTEVYGVAGYVPEDAIRIMRNLLLYGGLSMAEKAEVGTGR